jgi:hypothetical protein
MIHVPVLTWRVTTVVVTVGRYPNVTQILPNFARCQNNLDRADDLDG